jgi:putative membrane protein
MKKIITLRKAFFTAMFIIGCNVSFAQTQKDTVKTGKANDPMVVNPGEGSDSMAVKPGKTNDDIAAFTDTGFITKNISDNIMEIKLAKLGQSKGTGAQVKRAAALMIKDHTAMLNELKRLASKKGISQKSYMNSIPSMPTGIAPGTDFDKTWASEMLSMHEAKITELENYISLSADEDIKAAANRALPKIKMHRSMLMKIAGAKSKTRLA